MKKILIASHCMELGGAERSLLGILNAMDYHKYEVDLSYRRVTKIYSERSKSVTRR